MLSCATVSRVGVEMFKPAGDRSGPEREEFQNNGSRGLLRSGGASYIFLLVSSTEFTKCVLFTVGDRPAAPYLVPFLFLQRADSENKRLCDEQNGLMTLQMLAA